jgi:hypothetical protein
MSETLTPPTGLRLLTFQPKPATVPATVPTEKPSPETERRVGAGEVFERLTTKIALLYFHEWRVLAAVEGYVDELLVDYRGARHREAGSRWKGRVMADVTCSPVVR